MPAPARGKSLTYITPQSNRRVSDREVAWLDRLKDKGLVERVLQLGLLHSGDSREPELAGIRGALVGSALTLLVTLVLCLPIGVAAAIYLEEFAPKNRLTELIEVNINNLAAVPSIVFGLLGLAVFLNFFGLAALGSAGRRPGAGAARVADDHHRGARGAQGGAAVDQGSGAGRRCLPPAGDLPSRVAARHARHHDRDHHRHGARARRDRAAPHDRHGCIHRRGSDGHYRCRHRAAGSDLSLVGPARDRVPGQDGGRHHRAARCFCSS